MTNKKITPIQQSINQTKNWLIFNSSAVPYIIGFCMRQWTAYTKKRYPRYFLINFCGIRYTKNGSEVQFVANADEYNDSAKKLLDNLKILKKIYNDFVVDENNFKIFIAKINLNIDFLHRNFKKFIKLYDGIYTSGAIPDGMLIYSEKFFNEINNKYPNNEKEIKHLISPYGETFLGQHRQNLLHIAINIKKGDLQFKNSIQIINNKKISLALKKHQARFHWMQNNYKNVDGLSVEYFADQLLILLEHNDKFLMQEYDYLKKITVKHRDQCKKIKQSKIFSSIDFEKLLWLGKIAWWVDRRKQNNLIANHYINNHLKWLCNKHNFNYEDASFLLHWELDQIISGKKKFGDYQIENRKKESIHFYDVFNQEIFVVKNEAKKIWEKISPKSETIKIKEIKGMIANKGVIIGSVRIIMNPHNINDFRDGDILVTGMTRPDYLSLMSKASAFITDEGGITCHAAIVAREMKKPCIIGTKIATQILKDGDLIEVDANNGIIKIIKKAN
jgi:phosphohistidine swiveling domain-containing protein